VPSVSLPEASLVWLRDLHSSPPSPGDPSALSEELQRLARLTPAWTETHRAMQIELASHAGPRWWDDPLFACPQVVDVDFPTMAFDRAEWLGSSLYLGLAPAYEDPKVYTTFRVVGVEPRQWDIAGIDGAMVDAKANGVVVRVPLRRAAMSFTPSSY